MKTKLKTFLILIVALPALTSCSPGGGTTAPASTQASLPLPPASLALYEQVTLVSTEDSGAGQNPDYSITIKVPSLAGADDPRVEVFNALAASLVQAQVDEFKNNVNASAPLPADGTHSELNVQYALLSPSLEIISIKFDISVYMQGAAHPFLVNRTLNFDLESGQELSLDSLFLPNSDYLITIANFCAAELQKRDIGFDGTFSQGAAPLPENYLHWNISADGLLITFEQSQVTAGAAGPQTVLIPFTELAALINPQGALAKFLH